MTTARIERAAWCIGERQNDGRPRVYFGCPLCQAPMTLAGPLTADGFSLRLELCLPGCGAEFGVLLMGWREHWIVRDMSGAPIPDGAFTTTTGQETFCAESPREGDSVTWDGVWPIVYRGIVRRVPAGVPATTGTHPAALCQADGACCE